MSISQSDRPRSRHEIALATVVSVGLTVLVTWPQPAVLATQFVAHTDSYFSTWRLMWIAHALRTDPRDLFDANIFHPTTGTLAYSDATLLQGLLATPFLWAGASPVVVYNVILLLGFVSSGIAMFVLARHVTGRVEPALVAAAVFVVAPYRTEHVMHLEMQWAMWIPLVLWALTRTVEERSWRFGALSGLFLWLQVLSCVYYGIFLAVTVLVFVPLLLIRARAGAMAAMPPLVLAAAIAAALTVPYALPYIENARSLSDRPVSDLRELSATPLNYFATPGDNRWWGWTSETWGANERRLFPGVVTLLLAAAAWWGRSRPDVWLYLVLAWLGIEMSRGVNGWLYAFLYDHVQAFRGLRSPARFFIIGQCGIAILAGLGMRALLARLRIEGGSRTWGATATAVLAVAIECANRPLVLEPIGLPNQTAHDVYREIRAQGPGIVLELPLPTLDELPGPDAVYAFWSGAHWNPLINGYSGYYPKGYHQTLSIMRSFPDEESIAHIQRLGVRYIVVHREFLARPKYEALRAAMADDPRLKPFGELPSPAGQATLFLLQPAEQAVR
jgi:hypothetical protein